MWVAIVILSALTWGCDSSPDPGANDSASPSRLEIPSDPPPPAAMKHAPERGTCWLAPKRAFAPDFWFDDLSRQVPCTEPHTTQTVTVDELDKPTIGEATEWLEFCADFVKRHLDISPEHWVPHAAVGYLPSREQIADGASWARCDAALPDRWNYNLTSIRATTFPLEHAATARSADLQACLDQHPRILDQPFVDCTHPHAYESTGQLSFLQGLSSYPSAERRRRESRQCRADLPPAQSSPQFAVVAAWDPPRGLGNGELFGVCFVHRADGSPLG